MEEERSTISCPQCGAKIDVNDVIYHQIEAIVEGFVQMQTDLDSEKRSMQGIWKKRQKQIEKVILNTSHMYSSIRGIAGTAIQPVKQLELPKGDMEE